MVAPVLHKMESSPERIGNEVEAELARRARVTGGAEPGASRHLRMALEHAEAAARTLDDSYLSTEHLLLGLAEAKGDAARILKRNGVSPDRLATALEAIRGSHRATDRNPEEKYQALKRFSHDLTARARRGKSIR